MVSLVYRTADGQSVCLAGRYGHKYCMELAGSGHFAKQTHLKHQDHSNLWLEKFKREKISVFILENRTQFLWKIVSGNTC